LAFALGTSEFMTAGLLPQIAAGVEATIPQAGYLISAFALGMIVGAPVMAVLTLRLPRRTTLVATLAVVVAAHVAGAFATGYGVLLASRVVAAVATGGFWAVAAVVTVASVAPQVRARALALLVGGLTVANVAGVPFGTVLGQQYGWRAAFWAIAALALLAAVGVLLSVPGARPDGAVPRLSAEFTAFRRGRLWLALGTTAVYQTAMMGTFAYVAPLLTETAGIGERWVPAVLLGFGVGGLAGAPLNAGCSPWPEPRRRARAPPTRRRSTWGTRSARRWAPSCSPRATTTPLRPSWAPPSPSSPWPWASPPAPRTAASRHPNPRESRSEAARVGI
jgi:DHA1 family chloramphenicol resistance protein-like MFS transporter